MAPDKIGQLRGLTAQDKQDRLRELLDGRCSATPDEMEERVWLEIDLHCFALAE